MEKGVWRYAILSTIVVCVCFVTLRAEAQDAASETKVTSSVAFGVFSDYMFRGIDLYDGTSLQPSASIGLENEGLSAQYSVWSHLSGEGDRQSEKFTEVDHTVSVGAIVDHVSIKLGHIWYTYPDSDDGIHSTKEIYASFAVDDSDLCAFSLTPTFTAYHDYDLFDGQYYELAFSHPFDLGAENSNVSVTPFAVFAFASNLEKVYADDGLVHTTVGVSAGIPIGPLTLTPSINYTLGSDRETDDELWSGTTLSWSY